MGKDLIIGGAFGYGWNELKYWVNSIKKSGFTGDIALVATKIKREDIEKLDREGVILSLYGREDEHGNFHPVTDIQPHIERFFYIWNFLRTTEAIYDHVITTDTRDVVFQTNPSEWMTNLDAQRFNVVCSSEGLKYKDEPWGYQNVYDTFGPFFQQHLKDREIFNVGTIAGQYNHVMDFLLMIFQMSINRPAPIVDQAVFNFIINQQPYKSDILFSDSADDWAIQLGTTEEAVKFGSGVIGDSVRRNPAMLDKYYSDYMGEQPKFDEDGTVRNPSGEKYCVVHQYDRIGFLKPKILAKYDD